jgi:hypothetical protein
MDNMWIAIMVIGIVAISAVSRVLRAKYNAQHGIITDRKGRPIQALAQPKDSELQREVETLRERIKVLERIATVGRQSNNLAAEIESLRGQ